MLLWRGSLGEGDSVLTILHFPRNLVPIWDCTGGEGQFVCDPIV